MRILETLHSLIQFNLDSDAGKIRSIPKKINILILAHDYRPKLGGIATATYELAKALAQTPGVSVKLLAPGGPAASLGDQHDSFITRRIRVHDNSFLAIFQFAFYLIGEVWRHPPDLILSTLWLPCSVASWLVLVLRLIKNIPFFTVVHGVEILESRRTLKKRIRSGLVGIKRQVFKKSAGVLPVSRFTAECLSRETGLATTQMRVIYNGVDSATFTPQAKPKDLLDRYGLSGRFIFLTVSRLEDYKGVDRFIEAVPELARQYPKMIYLVAGRGPDQMRLNQKVAELGVQDFVRFLGGVPQAELTDLYNLSDVFVLLSRDDRVTPNFEGLGIVLLEAGACGKPALAGDSGGIPEVVEDGVTGWVVPPENVPEITKAALDALKNTEKVAKLGQAARQRVVQEFNWAKVAEKVVQEFEKNVRN